MSHLVPGEWEEGGPSKTTSPPRPPLPFWKLFIYLRGDELPRGKWAKASLGNINVNLEALEVKSRFMDLGSAESKLRFKGSNEGEK